MQLMTTTASHWQSLPFSSLPTLSLSLSLSAPLFIQFAILIPLSSPFGKVAAHWPIWASTNLATRCRPLFISPSLAPSQSLSCSPSPSSSLIHSATLTQFLADKQIECGFGYLLAKRSSRGGGCIGWADNSPREFRIRNGIKVESE